MKPFDIEITSISKGPDELTYQLPISAKIIKQIPGKDRPDYFIAKLEKSIVWVNKSDSENKEISHIVLCSKKKNQDVSKDMKGVIIAIAYILHDSVLTDSKLNFKKCKYIAVGTANAVKKWGLF
jgi:hypothetical protein